MDSETKICPNCAADWDAGDVFSVLRKQSWCAQMSDEELRHKVKEYYGDENARFSRLIGVEDPRIYDGVYKWQCPDCGHEWPRFSESLRR